MISFIAFVPGSFLLNYIDTGIYFLNKIFYFIPIVTFFTYCFLLKLTIIDWIKDKRWKKIREIEVQNKLELEKELKEFVENDYEFEMIARPELK